MIRGGHPPTAKWQPSDRQLAYALTVYEQSLCPGCGQPRSACWDDQGEWDHHTTNCASCAVLERHSDNEKKPIPGQKAWTTPAVANPAGEVGPVFD